MDGVPSYRAVSSCPANFNSGPLMRRPRQYAQYGPENLDLHLPTALGALDGNPSDDTTRACNLPKMTRDGASACSSVLRKRGYRPVQRWRPKFRREHACAPFVPHSIGQQERFSEEAEDPNYPAPTSGSWCTHQTDVDKVLPRRPTVLFGAR